MGGLWLVVAVATARLLYLRPMACANNESGLDSTGPLSDCRVGVAQDLMLGTNMLASNYTFPRSTGLSNLLVCKAGR